MKRLHVHISAEDLEKTIGFYSTLFGTAPDVRKSDYAKWMLDDPAVNFAVSHRDGSRTGVSHLGFQFDGLDELDRFKSQLKAAGQDFTTEEQVTCCYANGDKAWVTDPEGIPWEAFKTHHLVLDDEDLTVEQQKMTCDEGSICCA